MVSVLLRSEVSLACHRHRKLVLHRVRPRLDIANDLMKLILDALQTLDLSTTCSLATSESLKVTATQVDLILAGALEGIDPRFKL